MKPQFRLLRDTSIELDHELQTKNSQNEKIRRESEILKNNLIRVRQHLKSEISGIKKKLGLKSENTDYHNKSKKLLLRSFWAIGLFYTGYQITLSVDRYLHYGSTISQKDMMDEEPLPFPIIFLCPDSIHSLDKDLAS